MGAVAVALVACSTALLDDPAVDQADSLRATVDAWRERTPVPGVVVGVAGPEVGEYLLASGTLQRDAGEPVAISTRFRVGSITKLLVAGVVLQLVEGGSLTLADYVVDVALGAAEPLRAAGLLDGVTVEDLLRHTSGLPDSARSSELIDSLEADPAAIWTPDQVFALVSKSRREFDPGTSFGYSNTNFLLLGEVIEGVTGNPWWNETRTRILDPLDMADSYLAGFESHAGPLAPGYFDLDNDGFTEELDPDWPALETTEGPAGTLVSTVPDLLRFGGSLFGGEVVSGESLKVMTSPGRFSSRYTGYGLGLEISKPDLETTVWGHGGFVPGYRAVLWHAPEPEVTIVVLTNESRSRPDGLAELALRIAGRQ